MESKQRTTRQRTAIAQLLAEQDSFLSAQQLYALLAQSGSSVGLTTVYRTLTSMAESHAVDTVRNGDGEITYRHCAPAPHGQHHHHLVCRSCGKAQMIVDDAIEKWATNIAAQHGYTEVDHELEFFGLCQECSS
ncbi:MAG: Fur family transcriptional regulator [Propionibacteriaceae bacterium]